ncbi:OfxX fusion product [Pseudomonas sichuanensis]|uniref:OfxX fusion product n=1 Tax=Pseudomonas TaxID=286 RepID=UPI0036E7F4FB
MRVKIEGEITPDRMARAVESALRLLASADPDAKFYGANLYLNSYGMDGESFDVVDDDQNPLGLRISAPAGTAVKPALTSEAKQRRKAVREEQHQRELEAAERCRQEDAERLRKRQAEAARAAKAKETFEALNALTSQLLDSDSQRLVDGFNEVIRASWQALGPTETQGPKKGEPKPLPVFTAVDGKLVLATPAWKATRWMLNPVGTPREGLIAPVWTFSAWVAAVEGFLKIMESMSGPLPEVIKVGPYHATIECECKEQGNTNG